MWLSQLVVSAFVLGDGPMVGVWALAFALVQRTRFGTTVSVVEH